MLSCLVIIWLKFDFASWKFNILGIAYNFHPVWDVILIHIKNAQIFQEGVTSVKIGNESVHHEIFVHLVVSDSACPRALFVSIGVLNYLLIRISFPIFWQFNVVDVHNVYLKPRHIDRLELRLHEFLVHVKLLLWINILKFSYFLTPSSVLEWLEIMAHLSRFRILVTFINFHLLFFLVLNL